MALAINIFISHNISAKYYFDVLAIKMFQLCLQISLECLLLKLFKVNTIFISDV